MKKKNAAITIQAHARGHKTRKQKKKMDDSARVIQRNYRKYRARKKISLWQRFLNFIKGIPGKAGDVVDKVTGKEDKTLLEISKEEQLPVDSEEDAWKQRTQTVITANDLPPELLKQQQLQRRVIPNNPKHKVKLCDLAKMADQGMVASIDQAAEFGLPIQDETFNRTDDTCLGSEQAGSLMGVDYSAPVPEYPDVVEQVRKPVPKVRPRTVDEYLEQMQDSVEEDKSTSFFSRRRTSTDTEKKDIPIISDIQSMGNKFFGWMKNEPAKPAETPSDATDGPDSHLGSDEEYEYEEVTDYEDEHDEDKDHDTGTANSTKPVDKKPTTNATSTPQQQNPEEEKPVIENIGQNVDKFFGWVKSAFD